MGIRRLRPVFVPMLLALAFQECRGFGISGRVFNRKCTPMVQHIPVDSTGGSFCHEVSATFVRAANPVGDASKERRWPSQLDLRPTLQKVAQWRPSNVGITKTSRAVLVSVASALMALLVRPTRALAMGGGMGGSKAAVAPMQR